MSYQKAIVCGNIGTVGELKEIGGTQIFEFSVAVSKTVKKEQVTTWFNVVVFGKLASICSKYLEKGRMVLCDGEIELREWEDKNGAKRSKLRLVASQAKFFGKPVGPKEEQLDFDPNDPPF